MTTLLVESLSTESISAVCTLGWRWSEDRVEEADLGRSVRTWGQHDTSVESCMQTNWQAWLMSGSSVMLTAGAMRHRLCELYTWIHPKAVAEFLLENPSAASLLLEAYEQIQRVFGPSIVTLDVSIDPDGYDEPRLVARVRTRLDPLQALDLLDQFDTDWWLDASLKGGDRICITLEYA